ncbi:MAG: hypothetical protein IT426_03770 [Pirellulales bacterium]|nr:hypothetical protein [Pirellulales bacterium]
MSITGQNPGLWLVPLVVLTSWCFPQPLPGENTLVQPAQPWAGAALDDWSNALRATVISDLSHCRPESALSPMVLKPKCWKVIPYRMIDGYEGKMVWAAAESEAPEISLALEAEGWHAIFVGLFSATEVPTTAWLRLDDDPAPVPRFNPRVAPRQNAYGHSEEVFFRAVRLRKESRLLLSPQTTGNLAACGITHVKLIPLSAEEIRQIEAESRDASHRVLAATNDGFSDLFYRSPRTASALLSAVEIFRDTDFGTLLLQSPGADKVNYRSKIGYMKGSHAEVFPRSGDRHFVESIRALAARNINLPKTLIDGAHAIGMKVHVGIRPAGWSFFEPYADYWESPFYKEHPQWRCEDRDGTPVARMSWAVPEVRRHLLDLLAEQVRFGADGANLVFTRGYPLVLYEAPARKPFEKQYGVDPRKIPESDPRIAAFRGEIVTRFFRELRAMLDEESRRRGDGKRLALSVLMNATAQDDLFFGVDLRRLAGEGLVDEVFTELGFGATAKTFNLEFLREVCRPRGIPFSPGIYGSATVFNKDMLEFYDAEARGLTVWDAEVRDIYEWRLMSRFGHAGETRWRSQNLNPKKIPRTIHYFQKLGDQIRDGRYEPCWGG